ncbi:hypothetical protein JCM8547_007682 [Rhodosporidiobolus lusitaniae]
MFEGTVSEELECGSGLPRGSHLFPILVYNAAFFRLSRLSRSRGFGWMGTSTSSPGATRSRRPWAPLELSFPGLEAWSDSHFSAFEPSKTLATLFIPPGKKNAPSPPPPVVLRGKPLANPASLGMLGVEINSNRLFRPHHVS